MRSRFAVCLLGVWSLLVAASATTQAQQPAPGTVPSPRIYTPGPNDDPNSWPAWGVPAYSYPDDGHIYTNQQYGIGPDGITTERLPADKGWAYEDTPADRFVSMVAKSTWFRLEFLNYNFQDPGHTLLGSAVGGVVDPSRPFQTTVDGQPATAKVPTTEQLHFRNVQGIRGTIGLPTNIGSFEANFMAFQREHSDDFRNVPDGPVLNPSAQIQLATSTLTNGKITDVVNGVVVPSNIFLYDKSFQVFQNTALFGGEANWIAKSQYEDGFVTRALAGFRYLDIHESLGQRGTFDQQGALSPNPADPATSGLTPLVSYIDSDANNRVYAPQLGMRFEYVTPWLTLGIEPKVGFGINNYKASVSTLHLRSQGDAFVQTQDSGTRFTPIGDFSVYSKVHVRDNFSINVGYQIMVAGGITRPANNIYYNDTGATNPAAIVVDPSFHRMVWQGLTIGGELKFR